MPVMALVGMRRMSTLPTSKTRATTSRPRLAAPTIMHMHCISARGTWCLRAVVVLLIGLSLGQVAGAQAGLPQDATLSTAPGPESTQRFGEVPGFEFIERSGETVSLEDLRGKPWIGVPFYVRCTGPCPSLTGDIRAILYEQLKGTDVRIVSFSVDPEYDTPEKLSEYAQRFDIQDERWLFLTGPGESVPDYVRQGLKLAVLRADPAEELPAGESVTHATRLAMIDAEGRLAGWYECASPELGREGIEASFEALIARAKALNPQRQTSILPAINASLNALAGLFLVLGLLAIKAGKREVHERWMKVAFLASAAFLSCYLYYHLVVTAQTGPTRYSGEGLGKLLYLGLLISHVILAVVNLPMVLRTFWLAHKQDWDRHKRMARLTFPIWLYVSVTGVMVYVVLYHL
ncbi:MAG: protein SCO1/2 [Planctomycetota bacterium]|jgi:protein SCO1/2